MLSDIVVGAIAGAVVVGICVLVALLRKLPAKTAVQTKRRLSLTSFLSPSAVFQKLKSAAWPRLKVVDSDQDRGVLILTSPLTVFSWGFFYPVFITPSGSGSTIEVGIKSRAIQWGPIVTNNHKACVAEIENALKA